MRRFGLLGESIAYSLSPRLHGMIFSLLGETGASYELIDIPQAALPDAIDGLRSGAYMGYNVTTPYKRSSLALADEASERARLAGACNLLYMRGGLIIADNTDVSGFLRLLAFAGFNPAGKRCALLGTGGAARAAAIGLKALGAGDIALYSRHPDICPLVDGATVLGYNVPSRAELIVNCAPHGVDMRFCYDIISGCELALDLSYAPPVTDFMAEARMRGMRSENGLPMLVWQALVSQEKLLGREIDKEALESILLKRLTEE